MKKFTFPPIAFRRRVAGVGGWLWAGIATVIARFSPLRPRSEIPLCLAAILVALMFRNAPLSHAQTWNLPGGGSWNAAASWNPATIPNAIDASVTFNGAATGSNPDQTGNRSVTLDGGKTVGSIVFNNDFSTFTNTIATGTGGSLTIDKTDAGPATIATMGFGTGNNTISAIMVLVDSVEATVDNTTASSAAGSLNLTGAISGPGGLTKLGDGLATFGSTGSGGGTKTYTGPTVLSGGRTRISLLGRPSMTSSFAIDAGAQLDLIPGGSGGAQTFTLGSGPLILNGTGATSGPFASVPGAIRNDRQAGYSPTITNAVVLQSDTLIHVQALTGTGVNLIPEGFLTLSGDISGPGSLSLTAPNRPSDGVFVSDIDQGTLFLTGNNGYEGGTFVNGGILNVDSDTALGAPTAPIQLNGVRLQLGPHIRAMLRASGPILTTARTLTVGEIGINDVGGTIDTNGNDVTFGVGSTITGTTLTKIGDGKMKVAGTQTYDTLNTEGGRTDIASAVGTGNSTINANAETNISASQTLTSLNIGSGAIVRLTATLPPAPEVAAGAQANPSSASENQPVSEHAGEEHVTFSQAIPEPGSAALLLSAVGVLFARRRR